jgi:hypothetical protein
MVVTLSFEDVPQNCDVPAATACDDVLPASVPLPDTGIGSNRSLAYEIFPSLIGKL